MERNCKMILKKEEDACSHEQNIFLFFGFIQSLHLLRISFTASIRSSLKPFSSSIVMIP